MAEISTLKLSVHPRWWLRLFLATAYVPALLLIIFCEEKRVEAFVDWVGDFVARHGVAVRVRE